MDPILLRLFVPVLAGVLLGLVFAARGFLRAKRDAPDGAGPLGLVPCAILVLVPTTKLFFAAILAFAVKAPDAPRFDPATVYFVAGNVMGLVAFAQGLVAAAKPPFAPGPRCWPASSPTARSRCARGIPSPECFSS